MRTFCPATSEMVPLQSVALWFIHLSISRTPLTRRRTPSSVVVVNVYGSDVLGSIIPRHRTEKLSSGIAGWGAVPAGQVKSTVGSVRTTLDPLRFLVAK